MTFFHIVFDKKGLEILERFVKSHQNVSHIVMAGTKSVYSDVAELREKYNTYIVIDFEEGAEKILSADKILVW